MSFLKAWHRSYPTHYDDLVLILMFTPQDNHPGLLNEYREKEGLKESGEQEGEQVINVVFSQNNDLVFCM